MVFAVYGPSLPHRESFTSGVRCPPEVLRMMRKIKSHEKRKVAIIRPSHSSPWHRPCSNEGKRHNSNDTRHFCETLSHWHFTIGLWGSWSYHHHFTNMETGLAKYSYLATVKELQWNLACYELLKSSLWVLFGRAQKLQGEAELLPNALSDRILTITHTDIL